MTRLIAPLGGAAIVILCATLGGTLGASAQQLERISRFGADVVIAGNTATSLGPLDGCVRVEPGAEFQVDMVVDAIPASRPIVAYEYDISYDPALLHVIGVDHAQIIASAGTYEPFVALQDRLPDTDGMMQVAIVDLASNETPGANVESGAGVVTRLTFRAIAPGVSEVGPIVDLDTQPITYPSLIDIQNEIIEIEAIMRGRVAIGQDCPGGPAPVPPDEVPVPDVDGITVTVAPTPGPGTTPTPAETPASRSPAATGAPGSTPGGPTGGATGGAATSTPRATPEAAEDEDEGDSSVGLLAGAAGLAIIGLGAVGAGIFIQRRRRNRGDQEGEEGGSAGDQ